MVSLLCTNQEISNSKFAILAEGMQLQEGLNGVVPVMVNG